MNSILRSLFTPRHISIIALLSIIVLTATFSLWGSSRFSVTEAQLGGLLEKAQKEMNEGNYTSALEALNEFERLAETPESPVTDKQRISAIHMFGAVQCIYNDFASAVVTYGKGLKIKSISDEDRISMLTSYAVSACFLGDEKVARSGVAELQTIPTTRPHNKAYNIAIVHAYIEKHFGDRKRSLLYFREALRQVQAGRLAQKILLTPLSELCEYYGDCNQADSALYYLTTYAKLADTYHSPAMIADARRGMLRAHLLKKDSMAALRSVGKYMEAIDSLYKPSQFIAINSKRHNEKIQKADTTIKDLQLTLSWQKVAICVCLLLISVGVISIYLRKNFTTLHKALYARNREIVALGNLAASRHDETKVSTQDESEAVLTTTISPDDEREGFDLDVNAEKGIPTNDQVASQECDIEDITDEGGKDTIHPNTTASVADERNRMLMKRIEQVMQDSTLYCDPDFSLNALAKMLQSNTKYVSQSINECTGQNFRSYINHLRIVEARKRLTDQENYGHLTIQTISESVGFRSTSNFIISFRKVTGLTPSVYIKMSKSEVDI